MKLHLTSSLLLSLTAIPALAGDPVITTPVQETNPFANAISPISNPTLADLAIPQTNIHAMYMHQSLPNQVSIAGGDVDLGGDINIFAVQIEYAFNERLSLIATKDGYIDFNPDNTLDDQEGFANLAAGLKYAFIYDPASQFAMSGSAVVELPTGNRDVFQGYGDGAVNLIVNSLKLYDKWQFSGSLGTHVPFDSDAESLTGFASAHVSYRLTEKFIPLVELNWFHVFEEGDGTETPISATDFEGGDLINLGSNNAKVNEDIVTLAIGARYEFTDAVSIGAAYEFPLTDEEENLMEDRITLDLVWEF